MECPKVCTLREQWEGGNWAGRETLLNFSERITEPFRLRRKLFCLLLKYLVYKVRNHTRWFSCLAHKYSFCVTNANLLFCFNLTAITQQVIWKLVQNVTLNAIIYLFFKIYLSNLTNVKNWFYSSQDRTDCFAGHHTNCDICFTMLSFSQD